MTPADTPGIAAGGVAAVVNHLLASAAWARERLAAHAGRTVELRLPPAAATLTIMPGGTLAPAAPGTAPDTTLVASPGLLLRLAARDPRAWQDVGIEGDTGLAETAGFLFRNLRWDFEEDLSRATGDVLAHRIGETLRGLERWRVQTAEAWTGALGTYVTEEEPLVASRAEIERFNREVDRLRDDVARLEARIARVTPRSATA